MFDIFSQYTSLQYLAATAAGSKISKNIKLASGVQSRLQGTLFFCPVPSPVPRTQRVRVLGAVRKKKKAGSVDHFARLMQPRPDHPTKKGKAPRTNLLVNVLNCYYDRSLFFFPSHSVVRILIKDIQFLSL